MKKRTIETAKFVKEMRKRLGLTQTEFAGMLGVNRAAVANYETRTVIPGDILHKIYKLDIKLNYEKIK